MIAEAVLLDVLNKVHSGRLRPMEAFRAIRAAEAPGGCIDLTRDEAAHAAWAIRQVKGWPKSEPDVIGWAEYNRELAERLEAAST